MGWKIKIPMILIHRYLAYKVLWKTMLQVHFSNWVLMLWPDVLMPEFFWENIFYFNKNMNKHGYLSYCMLLLCLVFLLYLFKLCNDFSRLPQCCFGLCTFGHSQTKSGVFDFLLLFKLFKLFVSSQQILIIVVYRVLVIIILQLFFSKLK